MARKKELSQDKKLEKLTQRRMQATISPIDFTAEQRFLQDTFASDEPFMFGTGRNLPQNNEILRSGGGLIKNGDFDKSTARMFGF